MRIGRKVRYPITVTKLHKRVGEKIEREEDGFEYTYKWLNQVGDAVRDEVWNEEQITPATWSSPVDGEILCWNIREGQVIDRDSKCMEVDEPCSHETQFGGLCAFCGKDMSQTSWAMENTDSDRANINMTHDQTLLTVSADKAQHAEEALQRRLLKNRKLSLVVDLDQTIIHACIEPTIGEWQRDAQSPNHEAVKDIQSFQLPEDGHKGGAPSGIWYYIKQRPGLKAFLEKIDKLYEMHVYTMGTRAYAQNVVKIVDPERKLFGDRVISRDENGSMTAKTLQRLFPMNTNMVVIMDDRADVWPKNRNNLIKVVPYDFYVGIGDINSSYLPKRQDLPIEPRKSDTAVLVPPMASNTGDANKSPASISEPDRVDGVTSRADKDSTIQNLIELVGGDDPKVRKIQEEEQAESLEKQLTERPLLQLQQQLEKEDEDMEAADVAQAVNGKNAQDGHTEPPHEKHHLLKDDDLELVYLESHLTSLHKAFFDEYEAALSTVPHTRVARLRPGQSKKLSLKDDIADLKIVPDVADVMPRLKSQTLDGVVIVLSGLVPLGVDVMKCEIALQAHSFGAQVRTKVTKDVTHCVVSANRVRTQKVKQCSRLPRCVIVNHNWLMDCISKWTKVDERPFLIDVPRDEGPEDILDDSSLDSAMDASDSGTESDPDGVKPDENASSPVDDLKTFDWAGADDELADFLESGDDGDESDTGSVKSSKYCKTSLF